MKKTSIILLLTFISICLKSQTAFYDALELSKYIDVKTNKFIESKDGNKDTTYYKILGKYVPEGTERTNNKTINTYILITANNPFLDSLLNSLDDKNASSEKIDEIFESSVSTVSGLDVTAFADGLAQFMISRAKDEISVAFIQRFKNQLEKYPEIQVLFPETSDLLENILAYEYTLMLPSLQVAFEKDLSEMFYNVENIFELPKYRTALEKNPEIGIIIRSMYIISRIEDGTHPSEVLKSLIKLNEWANPKLTTELKNLKAVLELGNLFSENLRFNDSTKVIYSKDNINYYQTKDSLCKFETGKDTVKLIGYSNPAWISYEHLDIFLQDSMVFKIFMGLVYQQAFNDSIEFTIKKSNKDTTIYFHDLLDENANNISFLRNQFVKFQTICSDVDKQIAKINELKTKRIKPSKKDYSEYIDVSLDVIEYGMESVKYFAKDNSVFMNFKSDKYLGILKDVNEFYKASYSKDYSTMVLYGTNVIDEIYEIYAVKEAKQKKLDSKATKFKKKAKEHKKLENYYTEKKNKFESPYYKKYKKKVANQKGDFPNALNNIVKYGTFMAQISKADSGAQVNDIIEAFALPTGSSSLKKYNTNNWALNTYLGGAYRIPLKEDHGEPLWKVYAPLGVAYTPCALGKYGSFSLYLSILDIGAVVDYRLKADNDTSYTISGIDTTTTITKNVEYNNKIQLGNIISPGIYFIYGFGGNIPLSIGAGVQYGPALTGINEKGNIVEASNLMVNFSLTMDIPIINIHAGKRKKFK